jgi:uncharacterized damage-inducible protein DinB
MTVTATTAIVRLHEHRAWVNNNLLASAATLSEAQLRQVFQIGQGSVWKSLTHLFAAEFVWLGALLGDESPLAPGDVPGQLPGNQLGDPPIASIAELKERWTQLESRWSNYLQQLAPEALDELVYKVSSSSGQQQRFATRRLDILLHVCTHAQYTSAQIVNMLRQLGVKPLPETMLISLARRQQLVRLAEA